MNKEFVPYAEALALKELGFDLECHFAYTKWARIDTEKPQLFVESIDFNKDHIFVSAPLYQQAFRWFREKYGFNEVIVPHSSGDSVWCVRWYFDGLQKDTPWLSCCKREEAELACLRKLIELANESI
jgi:hypothetical protein